MWGADAFAAGASGMYRSEVEAAMASAGCALWSFVVWPRVRPHEAEIALQSLSADPLADLHRVRTQRSATLPAAGVGYTVGPRRGGGGSGAADERSDAGRGEGRGTLPAPQDRASSGQGVAAGLRFSTSPVVWTRVGIVAYGLDLVATAPLLCLQLQRNVGTSSMVATAAKLNGRAPDDVGTWEAVGAAAAASLPVADASVATAAAPELATALIAPNGDRSRSEVCTSLVVPLIAAYCHASNGVLMPWRTSDHAIWHSPCDARA